jgi:uncharacterized protein
MTTILVDICHPAHAHFFRNPIAIWREDGCTVHVAARDKDVALPLMREFGMDCVTLGRNGTKPLSLLAELARRDIALFRHARKIRAEVTTGIGGIFAAHAALLARIPSVVFYDTEIATLQNRLTYPAASTVVVPRCYEGWTPCKKSIRYNGYHELSYLHPTRFAPDRTRAITAGLSLCRPTYLLRLVAWNANHDFGDSGLTLDSLRAVVSRLKSLGEVVISAESKLPAEFDPLRFRGKVTDIHHLMAYCAGYFGESATMASECAVLGVPAVYVAKSWRGYTNEQSSRYDLVCNVRDLGTAGIMRGLDWLEHQDLAEAAKRRQWLLDDVIDVAAFASDLVVTRARKRQY